MGAVEVAVAGRRRGSPTRVAVAVEQRRRGGHGPQGYAVCWIVCFWFSHCILLWVDATNNVVNVGYSGLFLLNKTEHFKSWFNIYNTLKHLGEFSPKYGHTELDQVQNICNTKISKQSNMILRDTVKRPKHLFINSYHLNERTHSHAHTRTHFGFRLFFSSN